MLTRVRTQLGLPWIKRPRGTAFLLALLIVLSSSSAYAQRGGCAGMGGAGYGGPGGGAGLGAAGGLGGFGGQAGLGMGGFGGQNPFQAMLAAQQMQHFGPPGMGMFSVEEERETPEARQQRREARLRLKAAREERSRQRQAAQLQRQQARKRAG